MRARAMLVDDHLAELKPRLRIGVCGRECTGTCAQSYMKVHLIPAIQALLSDNLTPVHIFLHDVGGSVGGLTFVCRVFAN
jgi:hypothetical protein